MIKVGWVIEILGKEDFTVNVSEENKNMLFISQFRISKQYDIDIRCLRESW